MRKVMAVAVNDLRLVFADGSAWINIFLVPLVLAVVIGYSVNLMTGGGGVTVQILDVLDRDQSALSRGLIAEVTHANANILLCSVDASATPPLECESGGAIITPESLQRRLEDEISTAYLEIPEGFAASVAAGEALPVRYRSRESVTQPSALFGAVQAAAASAGAGAQAERVALAMVASLGLSPNSLGESFGEQVASDARARLAATPFDLAVTTVDTAALAAGSINEGFAQSIPGMGSMYAIIATMALVGAWVRDHKQGVIQRARTMAVSDAQLLGGKVIAYFCLGVLQIAILFVFGYVLGLRYGTNPGALLAVMASFALAATGLALFVSTLVKTEGQAQAVALLVGLTMGPIGGAWWSLRIVPTWMAQLGHVTPIAWAMDGYSALIYRDAGWSGVAQPVGVLLGMAALFFVLGLWRIRSRDANDK